MFTLNRERLATELSTLSSAAEKKGTIPILAFTRMEVKNGTATLTTTDMDIFLTTEIDADGEAWAGCVPFKQLHDFVRLLDKSIESVSFTPKESRIEVKAQRSKMMLAVNAVSDFPQPETANSKALKLDGEWFIPSLQKVATSAADVSRMNLSGVYMESADGTIALAATDQHRLSVAEMPTDIEPFAVFLPRSSVAALCKLDPSEIDLSFNESIACFKSGRRTLTTRLLVGQFPKWRTIVPKDFRYSVSALTAEVQTAIRRASVTLDRHRSTSGDAIADAIRLRFAKEALTIETQESDKGHSEDTVEVNSNMNGETILIGFNSKYVMDALSGVGEQVQISLNDAEKPIVIRPLNSDSVLHVVMPCRI